MKLLKKKINNVLNNESKELKNKQKTLIIQISEDSLEIQNQIKKIFN